MVRVGTEAKVSDKCYNTTKNTLVLAVSLLSNVLTQNIQTIVIQKSKY